MKKAVILLFLIPMWSLAETEFQGIEWLEKYRDANGCIPIKKLIEPKTVLKECPKEFSPQIRPMMIGTLKLKQNGKSELCCYDWKTYGNR